MKIAVCVKQVPDTETKVVISADGKAIDPGDVKYILNPYDEFAVEEALRIRETQEGGEIILLCVGPVAAQSTIRSGLAMGADSGVLLQAENTALADGLSTARVLAHELSSIAPDLILTGKMAIDGYGHQVPVLLSVLLEMPVLTTAKELNLAEGKAIIVRDVEGGQETLEANLPCIITAEKGLNEPRYPALKGIMQAKKKPLEIKVVELVDGGLEILEMSYPPQKPAGRILGEGSAAVPELVKLLRDEAQVI